jgi:hypothetical protein
MVFFHKIVNSKHYIWLILPPSFDQLTDEEKSYDNFMHNNAIAHTAINFLDVLD